jgi:hypothetical protein
MNPTLAERSRQQQRQRYWRIHPPLSFHVPSEPPTALLYQPIPTPEPSQQQAPPPAEPSDLHDAPVLEHPAPPEPLQRRSELLVLVLQLALVLLDGIVACKQFLDCWTQRSTAHGGKSNPLRDQDNQLEHPNRALQSPSRDGVLSYGSSPAAVQQKKARPIACATP